MHRLRRLDDPRNGRPVAPHRRARLRDEGAQGDGRAVEDATPQLRPDGHRAERPLGRLGATRLGRRRRHRLVLRVLSEGLHTAGRGQVFEQVQPPLQRGHEVHFAGADAAGRSHASVRILTNILTHK